MNKSKALKVIIILVFSLAIIIPAVWALKELSRKGCGYQKCWKFENKSSRNVKLWVNNWLKDGVFGDCDRCAKDVKGKARRGRTYYGPWAGNWKTIQKVYTWEKNKWKYACKRTAKSVELRNCSKCKGKVKCVKID